MKKNNKTIYWIIGIIIVLILLQQQIGREELIISHDAENVIYDTEGFKYTAPLQYERGALHDFNWMIDCYEAIGNKIDIAPLTDKVNMEIKISDENTFATAGGNIYLWKTEEFLDNYYSVISSDTSTCLDDNGDTRTLAHELVHVYVASRMPIWADEGFANYLSWSFADFDKFECNDKIIWHMKDADDIEWEWKPIKDDPYVVGPCFWKEIEGIYGFDVIKDILSDLPNMQYQKQLFDKFLDKEYIIQEREFLANVLDSTDSSFKNILISKYGLTESDFLPIEPPLCWMIYNNKCYASSYEDDCNQQYSGKGTFTSFEQCESERLGTIKECTNNLECEEKYQKCFMGCVEGKCKQLLSFPPEPCEGAEWNGYPTCDWDKSGCKQPIPWMWILIIGGGILILIILLLPKRRK